MTSRLPVSAVALCLLAQALTALAADNDLYGDTLPEGAKARLGTARWRGQTYNTPVLAADGKSFLAYGQNGLVRLDPATGREVGKGPSATFGLPSATSADGKRAVTAQYDGAVVWDMATGKQVCKIDRRMPGGDAPVGLSADGQVLAAGGSGDSKDKKPVTVLVWDTAADKKISEFPVPHNSSAFVALSPDGKVVAQWGYHYDPAAKPEDE
ncbi:MAG: hypothetical protein K2V38_06865, partial [Gemmataceae bacterium]|nr:hypothetical protein [Gemmataceae bacterium]